MRWRRFHLSRIKKIIRLKTANRTKDYRRQPRLLKMPTEPTKRRFVLGDVRRGGFLALGAALLFGLSTPAAKSIVGTVEPLLLAGLLYLGSGIGLSFIKLV